jgi:hypothetical protein
MKDKQRAILVCWAGCGKKTHLVFDEQPRFAVDVMDMADTAGWLSCFDSRHRRTLVFCSEDCRKRVLTKKQQFPLRPPRPSPLAR